MKSVVITGLGVVSPLNPGGEIDVFWNSLCRGENAVRRVPSGIKGYPYNAAAWINRNFNDAGNMAITISEEAFRDSLKDSFIDISSVDSVRIGISLGTVLGDILSGQDYVRKKLAGVAASGLAQCLKTYPLFSLAAHLSRKFDLRGPCITVSTACSSGNDAIGIACRKILCGKADVMIAGGVDVLSDFAFSGFSALQAMTIDKVRPFDKNRTGLALGEGAAFIVLESEHCAADRKAKIYGRISGYASTSDAVHLTGPHKEGRGLSQAIRQAITQACVKPSDIDYISAHGTGTVYNDLMETKAVKSSMGDCAYKIPISSIKSMLGHSFGAAGVMEAISCLLAIRHGMIPPTINHETKDPECDLDYVPNNSRESVVSTALSISAGFGGQNSAVVLVKE